MMESEESKKGLTTSETLNPLTNPNKISNDTLLEGNGESQITENASNIKTIVDMQIEVELNIPNDEKVVDTKDLIELSDIKELAGDTDIIKEDIDSKELENEKIDIFDVYVDGKSNIYRKYKLRETPKSKSKNLNEESLRKHSVKIPTDTKKKKAKKVIEPNIGTKISADSASRSKSSQWIQNNVYTCMCCQQVCKNNDALIEHKEKKHKEECYVCDKCKISFSSEAQYLGHVYNHSKAPYRCKECLFQGKGLSALKAHIRIHSTDKVECGVCQQKVYLSKYGTHRENHAVEKYECGECGVKKRSKVHLDYHMASHTGVKENQCLYCGKGFARPGALRVHTRIHTDDRRYECDQCHMKFLQHSDLKGHKDIHFGKRFECHHCGKKFIHKSSIEDHLRLHTNDRPFKCPECAQRFHTKTHLRDHTYRKHIRDNYKCETCDISFVTKKGLTQHYTCKRHKNNAFKKGGAS